MADQLNSLASVQALQADLVAISDARLADVDRLYNQLLAHVQAFHSLLDQKPRSNQSRSTIDGGEPFKHDDLEYKLSSDFKQGTFQLADELNLDEVDAAHLFFDAQDEAEAQGRSVLSCAIVHFHQRRKILLDCLRLVFEQSVDTEGKLAPEYREALGGVIADILRGHNAASASTSFSSKCISSMKDIKEWLQRISDKVSSASVLGQPHQPELLEIMEFQRSSLLKQHELLGTILLYLVKTNRSNVSDFELVVGALKGSDKYDNLLVHYFPALAACISRFGSPEGGASINEARSLNEKFANKADNDPWKLSYIHAAFRAWWLAEYSGWYLDHHDGIPPGTNVEEENKQRSQQFSEAAREGAFDFLLSLSADVKSPEWYDPSRYGIRLWLQRKSPPLLSDSVEFADFFQDLLMEQLETFIESFITNLPDVVRKMRIDEDEQRQLSHEHEHDLDLERFLLIIAYAFEGRPKASLEGFWDVPDGVLIGFMYWASRRASTPLVSAFCEMLQAISEDEDCATAAHEFLLDDSPQSGRMRRTGALTWNQIFKELTWFTNKLQEQLMPQSQPFRHGKSSMDQGEIEPEAYIMLECYLRLISKICAGSVVAREYLLQQPSYHLTDILFKLAGSSIQSRFRACAFATLRSLLNHKTNAIGDQVWVELDLWITSSSTQDTNMQQRNPAAMTSTPSSVDSMMRRFASGFEEPNALVQLLNALVAPYEDDTTLRDGLPFPEALGSSFRMPGIDPYVDFAVGQVFGARNTEITDNIQLRLLQLTCLSFINTCLETFNEDLVIFANRSNVNVDTAIRTTDLKTYVALHPFSRVMEWMFNTNVMDALFSAIHHNVTEVASVAPDSPLIMCLLRGIRAVNLIMDLQSTYLDIVRPLIKSQSLHRRNPVPNAAYTSFEDGILNHLTVIPDLGLYCSTGHPELVVASLKLLEKISASPKLAPVPNAGLGRRVDRNKAIAALEENNAAEAISRSLLREIEADIDDTQGAAAPSYIIKVHILDFLIACLEASPGYTTIAHLLLGFQCRNNSIDADPDSLFSQGISLFHSILALTVNTSVLDQPDSVSSWLVSLKNKCLRLLRLLWHSPMSANLVMIEMRSYDLLFNLFVGEVLIRPEMTWNGFEIVDPQFWATTSAACLADFLSQRANILEYVSAELRQVASLNSPSLKERIFSTLFGSTMTDEGALQNCTIFDLFDFMDIGADQHIQLPQLSWLKDIDIHICQEQHGDSPSVYSIAMIEEILLLRRAELINTSKLASAQDLNTLNTQCQTLIDFYTIDNQLTILRASRLKVLQAWVRLLLVMVKTITDDETTKMTFVLQTLQIVLPRLESHLDDDAEAMELAKLAKSLVFSLDLDSGAFKNGDMGDNLSDKLSQVFELSLRAITASGANGPLKEIFYNIAFRYLAGTSDDQVDPEEKSAESTILNASMHHTARGGRVVSGARDNDRRTRQITYTVKLAGDRLIDLICDDALVGERTSRISALLLLGALVKKAKQENSSYIIDSLNRLNFISILVHSCSEIGRPLPSTEDQKLLLADFYARLALLVQISQTRSGATLVLNCGLFPSIISSGLFSIDPDLDIEPSDTERITRHYNLLAAFMRVICSAVVSRGNNEQTLQQARGFLQENRAGILAVLKRSAGLGVVYEKAEQSIADISDAFMFLMTFTGFVDFEEKTTLQKKNTIRSFT